MKRRPKVGAKNGKDIVLRAARPNAGIEAEYAKKLSRLVREMAQSYFWFVRAQYRRAPPTLAQDATPAEELRREIRNLGKRWRRNFDEAAPRLARWFARSTAARSESSLRKILKDAGYTVRFEQTAAVRDILDATVAENVALIRSIHEQYHAQVEGLVMRSVVEGRNLQDLTKELQYRYKITHARATLIARDQNNKATSAIRRAKEMEVGIAEGIWLHSHAGKEPRRTHLKNNGKRFSLETGWFDPDPKVRRHIMPGQLINCRCTWRAVVKGFS